MTAAFVIILSPGQSSIYAWYRLWVPKWLVPTVVAADCDSTGRRHKFEKFDCLISLARDVLGSCKRIKEKLRTGLVQLVVNYAQKSKTVKELTALKRYIDNLAVSYVLCFGLIENHSVFMPSATRSKQQFMRWFLGCSNWRHFRCHDLVVGYSFEATAGPEFWRKMCKRNNASSFHQLAWP